MVKSSAPKDYICPICLGIKKIESEQTLMRPTDIIYANNLVTAFINSFFVGENAGHAIVVPTEHYENVYTLPTHIGHHIFDLSQKIALSMKEAYGCDGITIRQNNELAGDQHAFHYHLHIFPRYADDEFNSNVSLPSKKRLAEPTERAEYAKKLFAALK